MTIEEYIVSCRNKVMKDYKETQIRAKEILNKKELCIEEKLDCTMDMGKCIGKVELLTELTRFLLRLELEKMEVKRND